VINGSEICTHLPSLSFVFNEISRNKVVVPEGAAGLIYQIISVSWVFIYAELLCRAIRHDLILLIVLFYVLGTKRSFVPNMVMWWPTCNYNSCTRGHRASFLILLMMGAWRPKHVEWLCRNKTCTVLHQVGVLFDLYYDPRKRKSKTLTTYKNPCSPWDSNPRSQEVSGRRPTP